LVNLGAPQWVAGSVPERFLEVDAARLLVLLAIFADPVGDAARQPPYFPVHDIEWHFTPE
jgi:hypothetical protein